MATRTASTHLSNIYQKLEVRSPGELADLVREKGLLDDWRRGVTLSAMTPASHGAAVAETVIDVRTSELDSFGHVNHAVFLTYLEHGRFEAMQQAGFSWDVLDERGWTIFVVRCEIDYLSEGKRGDRLLVRTWVDSFRRTSIKFGQEIVRAEDTTVVLTESLVTAVWIGPNRRPMRVPESVRRGLIGMAPPHLPTDHG